MSFKLKDKLLIGNGEIWLNYTKIGTYRNVYGLEFIDVEGMIRKLIMGDSYLIKNEDCTYTIENDYNDYYLEFDNRNRIFLKKHNVDWRTDLGYFETKIIHDFISDHYTNNRDIRTDIIIKYLFKCRLK